MNPNTSVETAPTTNPLSPDETFNAGLTAIPKDILSADDVHADPDLQATPFQYGEMNEEDARESGYITEGVSSPIARNELMILALFVGVTTLLFLAQSFFAKRSKGAK